MSLASIGAEAIVDAAGAVYNGAMGFGGVSFFSNMNRWNPDLSSVWGYPYGWVRTRLALRPDGSIVRLGFGGLEVFDSSGNPLWNAGLGFAAYQYLGATNATPTVDAQGKTYIGTLTGMFVCYDSGGNLLWQYQTDGPIYSQAAIAPDGSVYVGTTTGTLYAFR